MKVSFVKPGHEIEWVGNPTGQDILGHIERCGRTCYKSEANITEDSSRAFVEKIIKMGHESVLEHFSFSVRFTCDRGVSHELVRHRLASFSQESTRYVGYRDAVEFIIPSWIDLEPSEYDGWVGASNDIASNFNFESSEDPTLLWMWAMCDSALAYKNMLDQGWKPQQARSVLPNSLKTEIVTTANLREWRHILKLRTGAPAHPDIRKLMNPLLTELRSKIPIVFDELEV